MKRGEFLFVSLFCLSLVIILFCIFTDQNTISQLENRMLTKLPSPSTSGFFSGSFQEQLENALGDHVPFSENIRRTVRSAEAAILSFQQKALRQIFPSQSQNYTQIAEGYYSYAGDMHRIVEKPSLSEKDIPETLYRFATKIESMANVHKVIYWIDNSRSISFDFPREHNIRDIVLSLFPNALTDVFSFEKYEEYCNLFYQTDHHWNHKGSYKGYTQILKLLRPDESPFPVSEEITFPLVFNGSYARQTSLLCADEFFSIYRFDLPKMTTTMNGKRGTYGRMDSYIKGRYSDDPLSNHYSNCYGGEYGEIVYSSNNTENGNLLIIASSYSNPINSLLAAHFDKTFVIDPRYYSKWADHSFDPEEYAREHNITDLLLLGDIDFFLKDLTGNTEGEKI